MKLRQPRKPRLGSTEKVQAQQDRLRKKYSLETTNLYADMEEKYHATSVSVESEYWYIFGYTDMMKPCFLGPKMSEDEASRKADEAGLNDVRVMSYKTRDLSKATRQMKADLLAEMSADQALTRMKHQPGLDRMKKWGHAQEKGAGTIRR